MILPNSLNSNALMYMPHLPTPLEWDGVSSKENYLDTSEQTLMKLRLKRTHRNKYEKKQEVIDKSIKGINFSIGKKMQVNKPRNASGRLTFTTTYSLHLQTHCLRRLLVNHWHLIEKSPLLSRLFPNRPTIAFRTHKSIRKQLTCARLEDSKIIH